MSSRSQPPTAELLSEKISCYERGWSLYLPPRLETLLNHKWDSVRPTLIIQQIGMLFYWTSTTCSRKSGLPTVLHSFSTKGDVSKIIPISLSLIQMLSPWSSSRLCYKQRIISASPATSHISHFVEYSKIFYFHIFKNLQVRNFLAQRYHWV